jgi:hypothetical protein
MWFLPSPATGEHDAVIPSGLLASHPNIRILLFSSYCNFFQM